MFLFPPIYIMPVHFIWDENIWAILPFCQVSKRPLLPTEYGSKVSTNIRQRYLNLFIDELLKTCKTEKAAFDKVMALHQHLLKVFVHTEGMAERKKQKSSERGC